MSRLSIEQFVERYMTAAHNGETREEFARQLNVTPATVYMRASELRRHGIPLPPMPLKKKKSVIERARDSFEKMQAAFGRIEVKRKEAADRKAAMLPQYELNKKKIERFVKKRMNASKKK